MPIIVGQENSVSEAEVQAAITAKFGAALGRQYAAYAAAHPNLTPQQAGDQWLTLMIAQGLIKGVDTAVTVGGGVVTGVPGAAAKGAEKAVDNLNPAQWLDKLGSIFTSRGTWVRVAEGVVGLLLIAVAVAKIGEGTKVGKIAGKAALL